MLILVKKIVNRIMKFEVFVSVKFIDVDFNDEEMFIEYQNIYFGGIIKVMFNKFLNEGDNKQK